MAQETGCTLIDEDGNRYRFVAGIGVAASDRVILIMWSR
jgi:hypothetical protein